MRLTLLTLASLTLILTGCGGNSHHLQTNGATGIGLGEEEVDAAFPDANGKLIIGKTRLTPGTLIHLPKTKQEVIDTLKGAGAKFEEP